MIEVVEESDVIRRGSKVAAEDDWSRCNMGIKAAQLERGDQRSDGARSDEA